MSKGKLENLLFKAAASAQCGEGQLDLTVRLEEASHSNKQSG